MINTDRKTDIHTIRLILGDQLNDRHSWFERRDAGILYVIAELKQEATYVRHHVQKLCAFFAAMEEFTALIDNMGHNIIHLMLEETVKFEGLEDLVASMCSHYKVTNFHYQSPDEHRLRAQPREGFGGISIPRRASLPPSHSRKTAVRLFRRELDGSSCGTWPSCARTPEELSPGPS